MSAKVLVVYASHHGATGGIAEEIATTLRSAGLEAWARPAGEIEGLETYDAFVIGSAVYAFRWVPEAANFVKENQVLLGSRPVWLFSSGPLGTELVDAKGRDVKAEPKTVTEIRAIMRPRDHRVFFGAYDPDARPKGFMERVTRLMPAARDLLPRGDFRDWREIQAWATEIAGQLTPVPA